MKRNYKYFTDLVFQKARAGLKAEVSRGFLGMLWWVIEPILYMSVFYIAFAHILHRGNGPDYVLFLLLGLIAWKWFQATVNAGANSLMGNIGLMNLVYVPKIVFPLTTVAVNTFKFLIILFLFLIFLQFTSVHPSKAWFFLPALVLLQLLLIISVTCLLAAVMPFFPDLEFILENVLMMMMFISGIFFDIATMPQKAQKILSLNPISEMINMYRQVILHGVIPNWQQLGFVLIFSLLTLLLAILLFRRFDRVYPKIVY